MGSVGGSVGSVGPAVKLSPAEEHAYLEKWKQLQKYIDPLKRMINRIDKDEGLNLIMICSSSVTLLSTYEAPLFSSCLSLSSVGFLSLWASNPGVSGHGEDLLLSHASILQQIAARIWSYGSHI